MNVNFTGKQVLKLSSLLLFIFAMLELSSFLAARYLENRFVIFYEPRIDSEKFEEYYARYLETRHEILGPPLRFRYEDDRDKSGSRIVPAFPDPEKDGACVSIYGDSFTWASGVGHDEAWGNLLSKLLGCRVSNFGQPSYGTDQAYLRFELNKDDRAGIVILGHLSSDIMRNVAQSYGFVSPAPISGLRYKPRFILEDGELRLIPIPYFPLEDIRRAILNPGKYLPYEYFVPGGDAGTLWLGFPYSWSMLKALLWNRQLRAIIERRPYSLDFYDERHSSGALQLTTRIIESFCELARDRGKEPLVVIFPASDDMRYFEKTGLWVYQSLIDSLNEKNIEALNVGEKLLESYKGGDIDEIYIQEPKSKGHFNAEGNSLVADIIYEYMNEKGLLKNLDYSGRPDDH